MASRVGVLSYTTLAGLEKKRKSDNRVEVREGKEVETVQKSPWPVPAR